MTDNNMAIPTVENPNPELGHQDGGRTICLHSLAVLPQFQGRGLATFLMETYLDKMKEQNLADSVALIAHDHLIPYYERFGFSNHGPSKAEFGGGGWFDMIKIL